MILYNAESCGIICFERSASDQLRVVCGNEGIVLRIDLLPVDEESSTFQFSCRRGDNILEGVAYCVDRAVRNWLGGMIT